MVSFSKSTKDRLISVRDNVCVIPIICAVMCYACYLRTCTDKDMVGPFSLRSSKTDEVETQNSGKNISAPFNVMIRSPVSSIEIPIAEIETVKSEIIDRC